MRIFPEDPPSPSNEFMSFYGIYLRLTVRCRVSLELFRDHVMLREMTFDGRARGVVRINNPTSAITFRAKARIDKRSNR